ncbi:hypothetical protein L6R52_05845 [Myxococcota bacterium]|nr:hypothetical protein [Myxococcota bacterium]
MPGPKPLGELLVEMGLIDEGQLDSALDDQHTSGRRLGRILLDASVIDEDHLARALAMQLGLELCDPVNAPVHPRVRALIPAALAHRYGVVPMALARDEAGQVLYVATADPADRAAFEMLRTHLGTGMRVRWMVATESSIARALMKHHPIDLMKSAGPALGPSSLGSSSLAPPSLAPSSLAPPSLGPSSFASPSASGSGLSAPSIPEPELPAPSSSAPGNPFGRDVAPSRPSGAPRVPAPSASGTLRYQGAPVIQGVPLSGPRVTPGQSGPSAPAAPILDASSAATAALSRVTTQESRPFAGDAIANTQPIPRLTSQELRPISDVITNTGPLPRLTSQELRPISDVVTNTGPLPRPSPQDGRPTWNEGVAPRTPTSERVLRSESSPPPPTHDLPRITRELEPLRRPVASTEPYTSFGVDPRDHTPPPEHLTLDDAMLMTEEVLEPDPPGLASSLPPSVRPSEPSIDIEPLPGASWGDLLDADLAPSTSLTPHVALHSLVPIDAPTLDVARPRSVDVPIDASALDGTSLEAALGALDTASEVAAPIAPSLAGAHEEDLSVDVAIETPLPMELEVGAPSHEPFDVSSSFGAKTEVAPMFLEPEPHVGSVAPLEPTLDAVRAAWVVSADVDVAFTGAASATPAAVIPERASSPASTSARPASTPPTIDTSASAPPSIARPASTSPTLDALAIAPAMAASAIAPAMAASASAPAMAASASAPAIAASATMAAPASTPPLAASAPSAAPVSAPSTIAASESDGAAIAIEPAPLEAPTLDVAIEPPSLTPLPATDGLLHFEEAREHDGSDDILAIEEGAPVDASALEALPEIEPPHVDAVAEDAPPSARAAPGPGTGDIVDVEPEELVPVASASGRHLGSQPTAPYDPTRPAVFDDAETPTLRGPSRPLGRIRLESRVEVLSPGATLDTPRAPATNREADRLAVRRAIDRFLGGEDLDTESTSFLLRVLFAMLLDDGRLDDAQIDRALETLTRLRRR